MAMMYSAGSGSVSLTGGTQAVPLLLNTPSSTRIKINRLSVSFSGTSSTATPANCQLVRLSAASGTSAIPATYGPNAWDPADPASPQTTAHITSTAFTVSAVLWELEIPPTQGWAEWFPLGQEPVCAVSTIIGLALNAPASVTAYTWLIWTE